MKGLAPLFLGIFGTFAFSWVGLTVIPNWQIGHLNPQMEEDGSDVYPQPQSGMVTRGARVYAANGCIYCHSQQVRADYAADDIERKWGERRSAPRDYIFEQPVFLGKMRMGQDITNIGARAPAEQENAPPGGAASPAASPAPQGGAPAPSVAPSGPAAAGSPAKVGSPGPASSPATPPAKAASPALAAPSPRATASPSPAGSPATSPAAPAASLSPSGSPPATAGSPPSSAGSPPSGEPSPGATASPKASPGSPAPKAPATPVPKAPPASPSPAAAAAAANASPAASASPPWPVQIAGEPPMYSAAWHHVHLFSPRSINIDSDMPSYHFLYQTRRISDAPSADALQLTGSDAPPEGWEIVPTFDAKCLVAYLMSLNQSHPLKEVRSAAGPAASPAQSPAAAPAQSPAAGK